MNGITQTRFGSTNDLSNLAKQVADAVNRIETLLGALPLYFGDSDPNGKVMAKSGSIYIRSGTQGENSAVATPKIYLKVKNESNSDWLALIYTGEQAQTEVDGYRGSLYFKIPSELTSSAALYFKQSDDATPTGWSAL